MNDIIHQLLAANKLYDRAPGKRASNRPPPRASSAPKTKYDSCSEYALADGCH